MKQLTEKLAALNTEYQKNANRNKAIEADLAKLGMKPAKPSRAKAATIPDGLEADVKEMLEGKTVTAGMFDVWLIKEQSIYLPNEHRAVRKALKDAGVIEDKPKAKGQETYIWLAGETMGTPEVA